MISFNIWVPLIQFFKDQSGNPNIFFCGILPRVEFFSINRLIINEVNDLLKPKCLVKHFHFINQSNGWTLNNSALEFLFFYLNDLHLVEKANLELGKSILKAIDSNSNVNPYKKCSMLQLNECDFSALPSRATRCKPFYSPIKCVAPVRKSIRPVFKSFAQGYEPFRSTVSPVFPVPVSVCHSPLYQPSVTSAPCVLLEIQLQPCTLTYQTFAILMLRFGFFLQSLKLPVLLSLLFLLIKNMHLLLILGLITYQIKKIHLM